MTVLEAFKYHAFVGADPDLHNTAVVRLVLDPATLKPVVTDRFILSVSAKVKGTEAVQETLALTNDIQMRADHMVFAVEGQDITYTVRKGANPKDLLRIAQVAGGVYGALVRGLDRPPYDTKGYMPLPREWKGSIPKHIHQARICKRMGWEYSLAGGKEPYCVPRGDLPRSLTGISDGKWKHLLDAVGLALWAMDQTVKVK